ncbi:hypothetical protein [Bifidobacterium choerinum]|uniref:Phage protein n=1 Tax=Bifidobacterium choerinum TaxID=35760 RepID=A0A2D3D432_9BIFI|nr:hypothetical protein [Bifidobacterium choerinum]ATU19814.1 hypothetical protein BcFMB_01410 [Bifidobacterium choerinum]
MNRISAERDALTATLTDMLGDIVQSVSIDPADARPTTGRVAIVIEPPEVTYPTWRTIEIRWTLDLLAGTQTTQASSLELLTDAIELLAERGLNIERATPITFNLAAAGSLAAYQVRLNPLELN